MLVGKLDLEGRVRQSLNHDAFKLDYIILRQNNPSSALFCDKFFLSTLPALIHKRRDYHAV